MPTPKKKSAPEKEAPDEWWVPMQVAAFMGMSYQDARNAMLEGRYGDSEYDAKTRRLTVRASLVKEAKAKRAKRRQSRKKSRPHR